MTSDRELTATEESWSPEQHALLDAALDFYGAAETVIDYAGDQPRLRYDVGGLQEVRDAMGALEERIRQAGDAGVSAEQIASITRLEAEIVELILARHRATAPSSTDG